MIKQYYSLFNYFQKQIQLKRMSDFMETRYNMPYYKFNPSDVILTYNLLNVNI